MEKFTTSIFLALFAILTSCEKDDNIYQTPVGQSLPPKNSDYKTIDWVLSPEPPVINTAYYSQNYNGPNAWNHTRITNMNISGTALIDGQQVRFSGDFYVKRIARNSYNNEYVHISPDGYLHLCEETDDAIKSCLDFVISDKTPLIGSKILPDHNLQQTFNFIVFANDLSGKYDKPENIGREFKLMLMVAPLSLAYSLRLTGSLKK